MHKKIGIFCESEVSDESVLSALLAPGDLNPICFSSLDELVTDYELGYTKGIVFGLNEITETELKAIQEIVDQIVGTPLTILSNKISHEHQARILEMGNVFALRNPHELENLPGVFYKMFAAVPVLARLDARHKINLKTQFLKHEKEGTCLLTDISYGGACGLVEPETVRKGDFLSIHLPVLENLRNQWISARVVWEQMCEVKHQMVKRVGFSFAAQTI